MITTNILITFIVSVILGFMIGYTKGFYKGRLTNNQGWDDLIEILYDPIEKRYFIKGKLPIEL